MRSAGKRLTFGNAQPQLFLCEAAEGCFQSLGHHLFASWRQQGDISALGICQSQTTCAVKPWTALANVIVPVLLLLVSSEDTDRENKNTCGCASPAPTLIDNISIEVSDSGRQCCAAITSRLDCLCVRSNPSNPFVRHKPFFPTRGLLWRRNAVVKVNGTMRPSVF